MLVLEHVTLIDGTGSAPQQDMRIDIAGSKIIAVQPSNPSIPLPPDAKVLDLTGKTVIPGLVGMHEHLFYPLPERPDAGNALYGEMADSAPRLYLAGGVTTARTAGSVEPYTDLELKKQIDAGLIPGPSSTSPVLTSKARARSRCRCISSPTPTTPGAPSTTGLRKASPRSRPTTTSQRMSSRWPSATRTFAGSRLPDISAPSDSRKPPSMGIDNLEHGIVVDTEFYPGKLPDVCPDARAAEQYLETNVDIAGPEVTAMILDLVAAPCRCYVHAGHL